MKYKYWTMEKLEFKVEILPKKKGKAQEIKIIPILPQTGKLLTKRQMDGKDSDQSYKVKLTGKDERDIKKNVFPGTAKTLVREMTEKGLIGEKDISSDLFALANYYKEEFLKIECATYKWSESTLSSYTNQFAIAMQDFKGIQLPEMTASGYALLQHKICQTAIQTAHHKKSWQPGEPAPASASKRLRLLYLFLWHLKSSGICTFDFIPVLYRGKETRRDQLILRTSRICSFTHKFIQQTLQYLNEDLQACLLVLCGLRLNECAGLLWCNLEAFSSSQGDIYVLHITGQLDKDGNYTEYGKTNAAYRSLPVPQKLGKKLMEKRNQIESITRQNLDKCSMCGYVENRCYISTPNIQKKYTSTLEQKLTSFLRAPKNIEPFLSQIKYPIADDNNSEKITQLDCMIYSLSSHAFRRNKNTFDYSSSSQSSLEIYQQMGHSTQNLSVQPLHGGMTQGELLHMCLKEYISSSPLHPQQALNYDLKDEIRRSEIPACDLNVKGHCGQVIELTIFTTEPNTTFELNYPEGVVIEPPDQFELEKYYHNDAICFSENDFGITGVSFPFRKK